MTSQTVAGSDINTATNVISPSTAGDYQERTTYDANGNIETYLRNGAAGALGKPMDNLAYHYPADGSGNRISNRLRHVTDGVVSSPYAEDLETQAADNYTYDEIGNLVSDNAEHLSSIEWNVYGKISRITKNGQIIAYTYDASGNRIGKTVGGNKHTAYVRDASGNVMAVYEEIPGVNGGLLSQAEVGIYGSSRLGLWRSMRDVESTNWWLQSSESMAGTDGISNRSWTRGAINFELSNHLGNVLVTVSDRRIQVQDNGSVLNPKPVLRFDPDVLTANDYYPFGMVMPGRKFDAGSLYRYGFNGKEKDPEMHSLTAYDYGFRIYNPGIGKFLSVDPLFKSFPWNSPYSYAEGDVIRSIDLDGLEKYVVTYWYDSKDNHRKTTIRSIRAQDSKEVMDMNFSTANGGDLTDKDVWVRKLYFDGRQKEAATGKATLNASEKALFGKAITKKEKDPGKFPTIHYDLGDEKGKAGYESDEFSSSEFEYRMASQDIPLIKNLNLDYNNATFFYAVPSTGKGSLMSKADATSIDRGVKSFYDLPEKIKDDGGIRSVNITLSYYLPISLSDKSFDGLKKAFGEVANQVKQMFLKSGVKNVVVNTVMERRSDFEKVNESTPDIKINLKR